MKNTFQYLYDTKGKPIPFEYKLINNLPLTENDLTYNGNLNLHKSKITSLPDNLTVNGSLNLHKSKIKSLPNNLYVNGDLDINLTKISVLPYDLYVNGCLFCYNSPLSNNIRNDESLLEKYSKQIKGEIIYEW